MQHAFQVVQLGDGRHYVVLVPRTRSTSLMFPRHVRQLPGVNLRQALQVLSGLMQEDDENVELWYLMAVSFNSLQPPDCESARCVHTNPFIPFVDRRLLRPKELLLVALRPFSCRKVVFFDAAIPNASSRYGTPPSCTLSRILRAWANPLTTLRSEGGGGVWFCHLCVESCHAAHPAAED